MSGLQPRAYASALHSISKILNLSTAVSLRDLAIRFGCLEAEQLATETLHKYVELSALMSHSVVISCVGRLIESQQHSSLLPPERTPHYQDTSLSANQDTSIINQGTSLIRTPY